MKGLRVWCLALKKDYEGAYGLGFSSYYLLWYLTYKLIYITHSKIEKPWQKLKFQIIFMVLWFLCLPHRSLSIGAVQTFKRLPDNQKIHPSVNLRRDSWNTYGLQILGCC